MVPMHLSPGLPLGRIALSQVEGPLLSPRAFLAFSDSPQHFLPLSPEFFSEAKRLVFRYYIKTAYHVLEKNT